MSTVGEVGPSFGSQNSYEGISDLLKCYICFDRLKDAAMCPHCTKISCYHCVKKWISTGKPECPHCRVRLLDSDLIKVPSVQDLSDFIVSKKGPSEHSDKAVTEFCPHHPHEPLTVYCETCSECICSRCALWGQHRENQGHSLKPLEELYKQQKRLFQKELSKLKERMKEILSLVEHIEITMEGVKTQRDKTQQEIDKVVEDIFGRLNDQLRMKLQRLTDSKRYLKRQACQISSISTEIEGKISGSHSLIVSQREELQERLTSALKELESSKTSELEMKPEVGNFVNEIIPLYEMAYFEIKDFSKKQKSGEEIFSNLLTFCGLSWRLKVYPNGTGDFTRRYLGVFIELYDGYSQTAMYNYRVEMIHGAGHYKTSRSSRSSRNCKRDYGSDFAVGEAWGYKKFYDLQKLTTDGFLVKDTLLLKFGIRHPTYHQKCRDYSMQINDLKHTIMALKHQNSQLQRKCEGIMDDTDHDITLLKQGSKSHRLKSPKEAPDQAIEEKRSRKEKSSNEGKKKEEKVVDDMKRDNPIEEGVGVSDRMVGGGHQPMLRTTMSLSQPHLYGVHDRMLRMEKDTSRRPGYHPMAPHSLLLSNPGQRARQQQPQGMNYGHCIQHRRSSENTHEPQTVIEQRRQSYDSARIQQMMYEQSQAMVHGQMYPGSLSQAEYYMGPPPRGGGGAGGDYFGTINENHSDIPGWMAGVQPQSMTQSSPRRHLPPGVMRKLPEGSQTDIGHFMVDPGSPSTLFDESNSQLGPLGYQQLLSQELDESYEQSETLPVNPLMDSSITSQKVGYGMDMSQPIDHMSYMKKKSSDSLTLMDMDHLSRSVHTLHDESLNTRKENSRKPTRTNSAHHHGNLKSMSSEPQLNMHGPPGLQSSILPRLTTPIEHRSTSTLPRNTRSSKFGHYHQNQSQQKQQKSSPQHSKQPSTVGGVTLTQPSMSRVSSASMAEYAGSRENRSPRQDKPQSSHSSSSSTFSESSSPLQQKSPQSSNNQRLRLSGRSYKMSKKVLEGRSSPSKTVLSNATTSTSPDQTSKTLQATVELKVTSPDTSGSTPSGGRLIVGGNISNNTSLSQLDML